MRARFAPSASHRPASPSAVPPVVRPVLRPAFRPAFLALMQAAILLATALPAIGQQPAAPVRISEILADPDTTQGQREFVELWNTGATAVQLQGWKLRDQPTTSGSTNTYTFPSWSLPANGRVVVWGGGAADAKGPAWSNSAVWNNAGDGATLIDATGTAVDWVGYGTATPPATFANRTVLAAAARSQSLQLQADSWMTAAPTPGAAYGAVGGTIGVDVANAAPAVAFDALPASVRPGVQVTFAFTLTDPNGNADIASWRLQSGDGLLASGTSSGAQSATLRAPPTEGPWALTLTATDQAGLTATASATLPVRASDLVVALPAGGMLFGSAAPGDGSTFTSADATLTNLGAADLQPLLDISPFASSAGGSFAAETHVWVRLGEGDWLPYTQALMPLPTLPAGASLPLAFQLRGIPTGVAAGAYGASFSVVAA